MTKSGLTNQEVKKLYTDCVVETNRIVDKWIAQPGNNIHRITTEKVKSIFLGQLRRRLLRDKWDFNRFRKELEMDIDINKCIMYAYIKCTKDNLVFFNDSELISAIDDVAIETEYQDLYPEKLKDYKVSELNKATQEVKVISLPAAKEEAWMEPSDENLESVGITYEELYYMKF